MSHRPRGHHGFVPQRRRPVALRSSEASSATAGVVKKWKQADPGGNRRRFGSLRFYASFPGCGQVEDSLSRHGGLEVLSEMGVDGTISRRWFIWTFMDPILLFKTSSGATAIHFGSRTWDNYPHQLAGAPRFTYLWGATRTSC